MFLSAVGLVLKSRRFWVWQICCALIYALPVAIRLGTGNVILPVLSWFATPWVDHFVPGNLVEKILVNAFFPGGAGAVAGEVYLQARGQVVTRRQKYIWRLGGALLWTGLWSLFQLWGNMQNIMGSYGGNLFEYPMVYPLNFLLGSLAIFTPDVVSFIKNKLTYAVCKRTAKS
jgi:hypothetical protein